ncbi:MAG: hypothetical protein AseanaTS_29410 [Candidatus Pelagadaptatus aseana]|uniref:helix-turn-helix domain-containing protein n=1 Tax=Candidatus Pelagadaptatus aseana TaxID=3120508 RepID=UPI0039B1E912
MDVGDQISQGAFGRLLRYWRQVRRLSQEDVALEIDSSIKHISFLENGRSLPSRDIAMRLAAFFHLNNWETNYLLAAAGLSPVQSVKPKSVESEFMEKSLTAILRGADPFPMAIINRFGDVYRINKGWMEVIGSRVPMMAETDEFNIIDMVVSKDGLRPYIEDWESIVCALLVFLQQEVLMFQDRNSIDTLQRYLRDSDIPTDWRSRGSNRLTTSGMYTRVRFPGEDPQIFMHVINTVGLSRFLPEPALMTYSIFPEDWSLAEVWQERIDSNDYQHPCLKY